MGAAPFGASDFDFLAGMGPENVAEFCAANPTFARCVSPFEVQRRKQRENYEPTTTTTRPECPAGVVTADCVIKPKPGTHECPAGYSWVDSMQACNDD